MRVVIFHIGMMCVVLVMVGCVSAPRFTSEKFPHEIDETYSLVEEGVASYYADEFHGRQTSNGEIYDMNQMTAAHRTLPFNTKVRVINLQNKNTVVVRINDRGPFKDDRIIDLSLAAAKSLGLIESGTTNVRLEVIELGDTSSTKKP